MSSTAVLLIQLGTPDEPTTPALRRYLKQFLSDPRVIDLVETRPRLWSLILRLILLRRPAQSAAKYRRIWDPETGSPLLHYTRRQNKLLQAALPGVVVRYGMQVGNPSIRSVVHELIDQGCERLVALPMYPQYSATTNASATDVLFKALMRETRVPALRVIGPYYDHPAYLDATATLIQEELAKLEWEPDHYVYSFHGIPVRYAQLGDPYATHVKRTTLALQERLRWPRGRWTQSFQSLFGREKWLKPYTDVVLEGLARDGAKRVFVALPGFTVDCLETLDEIGNESAELFREAGGEELHACRCLNDHPKWIEAMATIVREEGAGWV